MRSRLLAGPAAALLAIGASSAVPAIAANAAFTQACTQFEAAPTTAGLRQVLAALGTEAGTLYINAQTSKGDVDRGLNRTAEIDGRGNARITSLTITNDTSAKPSIDVITPKASFTSSDGGKHFAAAKGRLSKPSLGSNGTYALGGQTANLLEVDNWVDVESAGLRASATTSVPEGTGVVTTRSEVLVEPGCADISYHRTSEHLADDSDNPVQIGSDLLTVSITPGSIPAIATPKVSKPKKSR